MFSYLRQERTHKANRLSNRTGIRFMLFLLVISVVLNLESSARADKGIYEWAYIRLNYARAEKVKQLRRFCDNVHVQAARVRNDNVMIDFFNVNNEYYNLLKKGAVPDELRARIKEFRKELNDYYVDHYLSFYDILFVSKSGDVFYTIRKQLNYQKNLFTDQLAKTTLAKHMHSNPRDEVFVDFDYYVSSDEPAAFFIEPAYREGKHIGWFVLQLSLIHI